MDTKIKRLNPILIVIFALLTTSILTAYAEYSQKLPISQSVTLRVIIPPKAVLRIDEDKIDEKVLSIDSKDLLNASSSFDKDRLIIDKVIKNGVEIIRVTKVLYEGLYQDL